MMVKSTITLPVIIMQRLDKAAEREGLTRAGYLEKLIDKHTPKLPGRPKG